MDPTSRRALMVHIVVVFFLVYLATALYTTTLRDMRRLQPSYPNLIVLTVATPPEVFVKAHLFFPIAVTFSSIVIGGAAVYIARSRKRRGTMQLALLTLHSAVMLAFIGLFGWAAYWCEEVFALLGTPPP